MRPKILTCHQRSGRRSDWRRLPLRQNRAGHQRCPEAPRSCQPTDTSGPLGLYVGISSWTSTPRLASAPTKPGRGYFLSCPSSGTWNARFWPSRSLERGTTRVANRIDSGPYRAKLATFLTGEGPLGPRARTDRHARGPCSVLAQIVIEEEERQARRHNSSPVQ